MPKNHVRKKAESPTYDVAAYWEGIEKGFRDKATSLKKAMNTGAAGVAIEKQFLKLLSEYLPRRYVVLPGIVVNSSKSRSPNIDLLISDCLHIPPLSVELSHTVFACESVAAAIEITSGPTGTVGKGKDRVSKLLADVRKLASVRKLGENREYQDQVIAANSSGGMQFETRRFMIQGPGPRSFLVTCGDEWASPATYERNLVAALRAAKGEGLSAWLHAAYSVEHGLLTFEPYTDFKGTWHHKGNALLEFVLCVNGMLTDFPTYPIDLSRYRSPAQ